MSGGKCTPLGCLTAYPLCSSQTITKAWDNDKAGHRVVPISDQFSYVDYCYNVDGSVNTLKFYCNQSKEKTKITPNKCCSGNLDGTSFTLTHASNCCCKQQTTVFYIVDCGSCLPCDTATNHYIPVNLQSGDFQQVVNVATRNALQADCFNDVQYTVTDNGNSITVENVVNGDVCDVSDCGTCFCFEIITQGCTDLVDTYTITYCNGNISKIENENKTNFDISEFINIVDDDDDLGQILDTNNTITLNACNASPGCAWIGCWTRTRSRGIVRELTVLAASCSCIGGTFVFEFSETGTESLGCAPISETRPITDFCTVRDFDLINSGEFYRVSFEPDCCLGCENIFITTTLRKQNDGAFVRLANQEIEEQNAAMSQTFAYQKSFNKFTGKSENVRSDSYVPAFTSSDTLCACGVFDTGVIDISGFNYIATELLSDVSGSLKIYFYECACGTTLLRTFTRPYSCCDAFILFGSYAVRPYIRFVYTNGSCAQSSFHISTKVTKQALSGQILGLEDFIPSNIITSVNRSISTGKDPNCVYISEPLPGISSILSTNCVLCACGIYTSCIQDISGYNRVNVTINSDVDSATCGLELFFYADACGCCLIRRVPVTYTSTNQGKYFSYPTQGSYLSVKYTNGSCVQCTFNLQFNLDNNADTGFISPIDNPITGDLLGQLVKTVNSGQNPTGCFVNIPVGGKVESNSTSCILIACCCFTGCWESTSGYEAISIAIRSDQTSVCNGIYLQFADDACGTNTRIARRETYNFSNVNNISYYTWNSSLSQFFRVVYENNCIGQNDFFLDTFLHVGQTEIIQSSMNGQFTDVTQVSSVRAGIAAKTDCDPIYKPITAIDIACSCRRALCVNLGSATSDVGIKASTNWKATQTNISCMMAVQLTVNPLSCRHSIIIKNTSADTKIFVGACCSIDQCSSSFEIAAQQSLELPLGSCSDIWAISECVGLLCCTQTRNGSCVCSTGCPTSPCNVLTSNNTRASLTSACQTITVDGYSSQCIHTCISNIILGFEGRKQSGQCCDIIVNQTETQANVSLSTSITTTGICSYCCEYYIAVIAFDECNDTVTTVSGLGLTWSRLVCVCCEIPPNSCQGRLSVWTASGNGNAGSVTANFSGNVLDSTMSVHAISGVDICGTPIGCVYVNAAGSPSNSPILNCVATCSGDRVFAAVFVENACLTSCSCFTELTEVENADAEHSVLIQTCASVGGNITVNPSLCQSDDWVIIGFPLKQAPAINPQVTLTYLYCCVIGCISLSQTISSETDACYEVNITTDRAWNPADVQNVKARISRTNTGTAAAEIDHVYLKITESQLGSTVRVNTLELN